MVETFAVSVSVLAVICEYIIGIILDAIPVAGREGSPDGSAHHAVITVRANKRTPNEPDPWCCLSSHTRVR